MFEKLRLSLILSLFIALVNATEDFYSFSVIDSEGKSVALEKYRGKVTLVVNVASECGFTDKHYKGLVNAKNLLQSTDKFEILAFPCNQFGAQEPKDVADILEFAKNTYSVNFPIFGKIKVNEDADDIYKHLSEKTSYTPNWNFWKYLIDYKGDVISFWGPWTDVEEAFPSIRSAVEMAIAESKKPQQPPTLAKPPPPPRAGEGASTQTGQQPGAGPETVGPPPPHNAAQSQAPSSRRQSGAPESAPSRTASPSGQGEGLPPAPPAYKHDDL